MLRVLFAVVAVVALGIGGLYAAGELRPAGVPVASNVPVAEPSPAAVPSGLRTVTLAVEKMSCAACPTMVRRTLEEVRGVTEAKVSYRDKTAVVTFDPAKCATADLITATARLGYPSSVIR